MTYYIKTVYCIKTVQSIIYDIKTVQSMTYYIKTVYCIKTVQSIIFHMKTVQSNNL